MIIQLNPLIMIENVCKDPQNVFSALQARIGSSKNEPFFFFFFFFFLVCLFYLVQCSACAVLPQRPGGITVIQSSHLMVSSGNNNFLTCTNGNRYIGNIKVLKFYLVVGTNVDEMSPAPPYTTLSLRESWNVINSILHNSLNRTVVYGSDIPTPPPPSLQRPLLSGYRCGVPDRPACQTGRFR